MFRPFEKSFICELPPSFNTKLFDIFYKEGEKPNKVTIERRYDLGGKVGVPKPTIGYQFEQRYIDRENALALLTLMNDYILTFISGDLKCDSYVVKDREIRPTKVNGKFRCTLEPVPTPSEEGHYIICNTSKLVYLVS